MKQLMTFAMLSLALLIQVSSRAMPVSTYLFRAAVDHATAGHDSSWRDGLGRVYFHKAGVTFPLARSGRRLSLASPFSGTIGMTVSCWSAHSGTARLIVATASDRSSCRGRAQLKPGLNQLRFSCMAARQQRLLIVCSTDCVFAPPLVYQEIAAAKRRNIFLISADNLGADHMSCYGYPRKTTPRIDAFCRDALRVTHAYAHSPWTLPSHMSLFSSLAETEHGVRFQVKDEAATAKGERQARLEIFPLQRQRPFLAENLSASFPAFSFNGGINVAAVFGFFRGFDLYLETPDDYLDRSAARKLFARTQAQLQEHPLPRAFYFLHTYQIHLPYRPSRQALAAIAAGNSRQAFDYEKDLGGIRNIFRPLGNAMIGEIRALYDAEVLDFDSAFGAFIEFLKTRRMYDSALIVLTSDHGEEFFEHGSWAHGTSLFNTQLKVPLIIKFPDRAYAGREFHGNAGVMDVLPTLLDYLGLPRDKRCRGKSLLKEFKDGPSVERIVTASLLHSKHWSLIPAKATLIQGQYKLIRNLPVKPAAAEFFHFPPPSLPDYQLFDLAGDAAETTDILLQNRPLFLRMTEQLAQVLGSGFNVKSSSKPTGFDGSGEAMYRLRALGYLQ